jgi:hypothetical protein
MIADLNSKEPGSVKTTRSAFERQSAENSRWNSVVKASTCADTVLQTSEEAAAERDEEGGAGAFDLERVVIGGERVRKNGGGRRDLRVYKKCNTCTELVLLKSGNQTRGDF